MDELFKFLNQYLLLFFFTTSYILIEYGILILDSEIHRISEEAKELDQSKHKDQMLKQRMSRGRKKTNYRRKFFSFITKSFCYNLF